MRERIAQVRLQDGAPSDKDNLNKLYSTLMATAAAEILERWKHHPAPAQDTRLEITQSHAEIDGSFQGFNLYLVFDEPILLGSMRTDIE